MKADWKTISLNRYYLIALGLNSMTLSNLENEIRDFIWRSQVFKLVCSEILKEIQFKYVNKHFL